MFSLINEGEFVTVLPTQNRFSGVSFLVFKVNNYPDAINTEARVVNIT